MLFIYDLIEELCLKKGVSITTLCKECKIPRSTLTDYKKGRIKSLSTNVICKIADYFDVSVDYLCGVEQPKDNQTQLKKLLFGDDFNVTDEIWNEVTNYVELLKIREKNKQ